MWRSNKSAPQRCVREQDAQGEKRGTWRLEEAVVNLNPSASELPRLLEPPLLGKEGLTVGILVFHLTCENDRWSCWARRWRWLCSPALCSVCRKERGNIGDKLRNTRCHPYLKVCGPRCVCFCFDSIRFDSLELAAYCCFYARKWLIKCWKMCTTLFLLCVNVICC